MPAAREVREARGGPRRRNDQTARLQTDAPARDIAIVTRISSGKTLDIKDLPPSLPPLIVKYEDAHFAVVVKPEGAEHGRGTAPAVGPPSECLPYFLSPTAGVEGALVRPRPVHRLDARTGGLLVVAKTRLAMTSLSEAFASRKVSKRYRAVLCGTPKFEGQTTIEVDDASGDWNAVNVGRGYWNAVDAGGDRRSDGEEGVRESLAGGDARAV